MPENPSSGDTTVLRNCAERCKLVKPDQGESITAPMQPSRSQARVSLDTSTSQVADRDIFAPVISGRGAEMAESALFLGAILTRLMPSSGKIWSRPSRCGERQGRWDMASGEW